MERSFPAGGSGGRPGGAGRTAPPESPVPWPAETFRPGTGAPPPCGPCSGPATGSSFPARCPRRRALRGPPAPRSTGGAAAPPRYGPVAPPPPAPNRTGPGDGVALRESGVTRLPSMRRAQELGDPHLGHPQDSLKLLDGYPGPVGQYVQHPLPPDRGMYLIWDLCS